ncbi:RNA polymerase sigma factor [Planctomycetota bacterium]
MEIKNNIQVQEAAKIFEQYGNQIRYIITTSTNDPNVVDDIYQDLFLSIVHRPVPPYVENIKGYIYKAVIHDIIDSARRTTAYKASLSKYNECRTYIAKQENPEKNVIEAEQAHELIRTIKKHLASHEARAIFLTFDIKDNLTENSNEFSQNKRTLSRYLCIGLKKIREFFNEESQEINIL